MDYPSHIVDILCLVEHLPIGFSIHIVSFLLLFGTCTHQMFPITLWIFPITWWIFSILLNFSYHIVDFPCVVELLLKGFSLSHCGFSPRLVELLHVVDFPIKIVLVIVCIFPITWWFFPVILRIFTSMCNLCQLELSSHIIIDRISFLHCGFFLSHGGFSLSHCGFPVLVYFPFT